MFLDEHIDFYTDSSPYAPPENKQWRTADGEYIHIKKMSSRHLRNTISMLYRRLDSYDTWEDFTTFLEEEITAWLNVLEDEEKRRKRVSTTST